MDDARADAQPHRRIVLGTSGEAVAIALAAYAALGIPVRMLEHEIPTPQIVEPKYAPAAKTRVAPPKPVCGVQPRFGAGRRRRAMRRGTDTLTSRSCSR